MERTILSLDEVRALKEGEVNVISSSGSEFDIPTGMTPIEVIEMLDIPGDNTEYVLDKGVLGINIKSVGTKG